MIDGTYKIGVDVLFGHKEGTVTLRSEGDKAIADLDAPIIGKRHVEGKLEGDSFTMRGSGKIKLVGEVEFTLKGVVEGDNLHINIDSNKGEFKFEGVRI